MRSTILLTTLFGAANLFCSGQTLTSVADGPYGVPSTWDCGCYPTSASDIVVDHHVTLSANTSVNSVTVRSGGHLHKFGSGKLIVVNDLIIQAGGTFTNDRRVDVFGDYEVSGIHAGTKPIWLRGSNTEVRGEVGGYIANPSTLVMRDGDKVIPSGNIITKNIGRVELEGITVTNNGAIQLDQLVGSAGSVWEQGELSWLGLRGNIGNAVVLDANALGSVVQYNDMGVGQQFIHVPQDGEYYRLQVVGNTLSSRKRLRGDVVVIDDLLIDTCLLDVRSSGTDHALSVAGNWMDHGGSFNPRQGTVSLIPTGDMLVQHNSMEGFYDLVIAGSGSIELACDLHVENDLSVISALKGGSGTHTVQLEGDLDVIGEILPGDAHVLANGSTLQQFDGSVDLFDLTVDNSAGLSLASGGTSVFGTLDLKNGDLQTNDRLVMVSDANGDSRIAEVTGGSLSGKVTAQRYIDAGATNWRFLTSPVTGMTLLDWKDDFVMSGFPGSHHPGFSFTSVFGHDEAAPGTLNDGFVAAGDISEPLEMGVGHWVWSGDNSAGTAPFTIDVKGAVYTGDVDLPVTYTDHGSAPDDGWNMVGNPYISVIDWDSPNWVKTNINDMVSIWNPDLQQFSTYINGVSTNGGSRYISSSQAFWVHANGPSPQLTIKEGAKTSAAQTFRSATPVEVLRLKIAGNGLSDEALLRLDDRATGEFDQHHDALEMISLNPDAPNLYSQTADGHDVQVNSFPEFSSDTTIYLSIEVGVDANYVLSVEEITETFGASCMVLEDILTNTATPLSLGASVSFHAHPDDNGQRFAMYLSKPLDPIVTSVGCAGGSDGMISLVPSGQGPWDIDLLTDDGSLISSREQVTFADFNGVPAGTYQLVVEGNGICPELRRTVIVEEPPVIEVASTVVNNHCPHDANGSIALNVTGGQGGYQYQWSDGSTSASLDQIPVGAYTVTVTDSMNCAVQATFQVEADMDLIAMFQAPSTALAGQPIDVLDLSLGADQIFWDMGDGSAPFTSNAPTYTYSQPGTYTITQNAVANGCGDLHIQQIVIDGQVGIVEPTQIDGVSLIQQGEQIFLVNFSDDNMNVQLDVRNVVGQLIHRQGMTKFVQGRTELDLGEDRSQVILITLTSNDGQRMTRKFVR